MIQVPIKYSVVIISMSDNLEYLVPCLRSVHKYSPPNAEMILVLNSYSVAGVRSVNDVVQPLVSEGRSIISLHLEGPPESFAQANNRGVLASVGDFVVYLNDDTTVGPQWLETLESGLVDDVVCVGPQASDLAPDGTNQYLSETKPYVDYVALCCTMISRKILNQVGLLDTQFKPALFEDADLGVRIIQAGYRSAEVSINWEHLCNGTLRSIDEDKRREMYEVNHRRFLQKHGDWLKEFRDV